MSDALDRRMAMVAAETLGKRYSRDFINELTDTLISTQFGTNIEQSDWRYFVDNGLRKLWPNLSMEVRIVVYLVAMRSSHEIAKLHASVNSRDGGR